MNVLAVGVEAVERGLVPDAVTRLAIRRLCRGRLQEAMGGDADARQLKQSAFLDSMRSGPIAPVPEKANQQHYELPPEFFAAVLGPRRKYSCCYWPTPSASLAEAEDAALASACQRAQLVDGQNVLELGCGWGSLSLWMAERYPASRITAMSNSVSQRRFIQAQATARGLTNLQVITADITAFAPPLVTSDHGPFDRVMSIEMFEHMRNYELLLSRIASWLKPTGKLFVHIFCHRQLVYPFATTTTADWMGRYFFTGGIMPCASVFGHFDRHLRVARQWSWNGNHYRRTAEAWLANFDARRDLVLEIFKSVYGQHAAARWVQRWRMFFLAVAELFGYGSGQEWHVSQYLLQPSPTAIQLGRLMSSLGPTLWMTLATIVTAMTLIWLLSLIRRDASVVDPFWGAGFVLVALVAVGLNFPPSFRTILIVALTTLWGLRLSLFLLWRNWGQAEDRRYHAMREHHGPRFWWVSLLTVFLLQAAILWFVSLPIQVVASQGTLTPPNWLDGLGILLWVIGFLFETIGDWQLARFKADPANARRVMDRGLWRYTRHPNYFGDFCVWWGIYLIAAAGGAGWTLLSPLVMSLLLLKVSGVVLLEKTIADRRPDYSEYRARTSAFFPKPPR